MLGLPEPVNNLGEERGSFHRLLTSGVFHHGPAALFEQNRELIAQQMKAAQAWMLKNGFCPRPD